MSLRFVCKLELCIIIITSVCHINNLQGYLHQRPRAIVIEGFTGDFNRQLEERGSRSLSLAAKGMEAVNQLLRGAKRVPSQWQSNKMRRFMKSGDSDTALKDFRSVHPINVKESVTMVDGAFTIKPGKVIDGRVGDRYLRLRLSGDVWSGGHPTLDIIDVKTPGVPYVDQIVYSYKTVDN